MSIRLEMNAYPPRPARIVLWFLFGVVLVFASLALDRPFLHAQSDTATSTAPTATAEAGFPIRTDVGSTDNIVLVAVIIVLIVVIPILLRRKDWQNGRRR